MVISSRLSILQTPEREHSWPRKSLEDNFDVLHTLFCGLFILPFFHGSNSLLDQQGASADDLGVAHFAVGSHCSLQPDGSRDAHLAGYLRIVRLNRSFYLSSAVVLNLSGSVILRATRGSGVQKPCGRQNHCRNKELNPELNPICAIHKSPRYEFTPNPHTFNARLVPASRYRS